MNEKITFPRLAAMVADRSGRSKRFSEDFLREFFALISEQLESGDSIKVKGLGTFRLIKVESRRSIDVNTGLPMEITGHTKVTFTPAKELAEAVNSPFEAFSSIEIEDHVDLSQIFTTDEISLQENNDATTSDPVFDPDFESVNTDYPEPLPLTGNPPAPEVGLNEEKKTVSPGMVAVSLYHQEEEKQHVSSEEAPDISEKTSIELTDDNPQESATENEVDGIGEKSRTKTFWISFAAVIIALMGITAVWYVYATDDFHKIFGNLSSQLKVNKPDTTPTEQAPSTPIPLEDATIDPAGDSLAVGEEPEVPTAPSDAIVYDTIGTSRFLTTMAKTHYGNFNLWPYIYEENKSILGHPDRIRPGTPVVIPKLSKYGVDPSNADDIEKAKRMGVEIYARYGKKI